MLIGLSIAHSLSLSLALCRTLFLSKCAHLGASKNQEPQHRPQIVGLIWKAPTKRTFNMFGKSRLFASTPKPTAASQHDYPAVSGVHRISAGDLGPFRSQRQLQGDQVGVSLPRPPGGSKKVEPPNSGSSYSCGVGFRTWSWIHLDWPRGLAEGVSY